MAVCGKGGDLAYLVSNANRMPKAIKTAPMPRLSHGTNRGVCRNLTVNLSPSNIHKGSTIAATTISNAP